MVSQTTPGSEQFVQRGVSPRMVDLILTNTCDKKYKSQSHTDQAVITNLRQCSYTYEEIKDVFEKYPIGVKYHKKGTQGETYLKMSFEKAQKYITENKVPVINQDIVSTVCRPTSYSLDELMNLKEDVNWYVENLIEEKSLTIIYGASNSGKTWFGLDLACCISSGEAFLGSYKVKKQEKVLYITLEDKPISIKSRIGKLIAGRDYKSKGYLDFGGFESSQFTIDKENVFQDSITKSGARVVIIDSLQLTYDSKVDELKSNSMIGVMKFYKKLVQDLNITIILLHHSPKPHEKDSSKYADINGARGSTSIVNMCDQRIGLRSINDGEYSTVAIFSKSTQNSKFGFKITEGKNETVILEMIDPEEKRQKFLKQTEDDIQNIIRKGGSKTIKDLASELNLSDETIRKRLMKMRSEGDIDLDKVKGAFIANISGGKAA